MTLFGTFWFILWIPNFSSKILDKPRKGLPTAFEPLCLGKNISDTQMKKNFRTHFYWQNLTFCKIVANVLNPCHFIGQVIAHILYITHQQKSVLNHQSPTYAIFCFIRHRDWSFSFINQTPESYLEYSNQFCSNKGFAQAHSTTHHITCIV